MATKFRLLKAVACPADTYGCESWTSRKEDEKRVSSIEMKANRRVLGVSWTEKRSNDWVGLFLQKWQLYGNC